MKKQLLGTLCILLCCGGFASAHDCGLVSNAGDISNSLAYQNFTQSFKGINIEGVMPAKAISQAIVNLKKACCMSQDMSNKKTYCNGFTNSENYPNSVYLYDHLLDVELRRLDGNATLAYDLDPDVRGKARREFITNAAQDKDGAVTAKTILERRNTDRTRNKTLPDYRSASDLESFVANYNSSQITLADKYYNMCNVVANIYNTLRIDKSIVVDTSDKNIAEQNSFLAKCQKLVNKRISDEAAYTKIIMIKRSNELLHTTMQAYTQKYFVQEKFMTLMTLVNKVKSLFSTLVQQAAVSKKCSE